MSPLYWWKVVNASNSNERSWFTPIRMSTNSTSNDGIPLQEALLTYTLLLFSIIIMTMLIMLAGCIAMSCEKQTFSSNKSCDVG